MSAKPENTWVTGMHKHLPSVDSLHREKMSNPYRSGTADWWYDDVRDLWVEYKFITVPKRLTTEISLVAGANPMLSVLQQDWLASRARNGRSVWVIVGCSEGGVIYRRPSEWEATYTAAQFTTQVLSRQGVAAEILRHLRP